MSKTSLKIQNWILYFHKNEVDSLPTGHTMTNIENWYQKFDWLEAVDTTTNLPTLALSNYFLVPR